MNKLNGERLEERKEPSWVSDNIVVILCIAFVAFGFLVPSEMPVNNFLNELTRRFFGNAFFVLSLVIPVAAGLGLNFGIVIGAMAGQIAVIITSYFGFGGISGLLFCFIMALPMAALFGYFLGILYNKTKGQEMIAGLIVVYFANSIYQFLFINVFGKIIKLNPANPMVGESGIFRMTIDFVPIKDGGLKYALDNIMRIPFTWAILIVAAIILTLILLKNIKNKSKKGIMFYANIAVCVIMIIISIFSIVTNNILRNVNKVPVITVLLIIALCAFNELIIKTKLGENFRMVGQNQHIVELSGINVNRTRIIATLISTVLAAWGQIICLQNMGGLLNTYNVSNQIGMLSVVALLVGGASISKANSTNAIIGTLLFNSVLIISPEIGETGFNNTGIILKAFMGYGVILYALTKVKVSEK